MSDASTSLLCRLLQFCRCRRGAGTAFQKLLEKFIRTVLERILAKEYSSGMAVFDGLCLLHFSLQRVAHYQVQLVADQCYLYKIGALEHIWSCSSSTFDDGLGDIEGVPAAYIVED